MPQMDPRRVLRCSVFLTVLSLVPGARPVAAESPAATIPVVRAHGKVRVDGRQTEGFWAPAAAVELTVVGKGAKPRHRTRVRAALDDEGLYFAFTCEDDMEKLVAAKSARDDKTWMSDCVEISLDPGATRNRYFHFIVNAAGCVYDAYKVHDIDSMGKFIDADWDGLWQAAVHKGTDEWSVEIYVPFAILQLDKDAGSTWAVTFARENFPQNEFTVWPREGKFDDPTGGGGLAGIAADLAPFRWSVDQPDLGYRMPGANRLEVAATNRTGVDRTVKVTVERIIGNSTASPPATEARMPAGERVSVRTSYVLPDRGADLTLVLSDAPTGRRLCVSRIYHIAVSPALAAHLVQPWYRSTFYATQPPAPVRVEAVVNRDLAGATYSLTAVLSSKGEERARAELPRATERESALTLPAADLAVGEHQVRVTLTRDGQAAGAVDLTVHRLPPSPAEVRLDCHGRVLFNGQPYLPIGLWSIILERSVLKECADAGFNAVLPPPHLGTRDERFLDELHAHGMKAVLHRAVSGVSAADDQKAAGAREMLARVREHPALLAYMTEDEPELRWTAPDELRRRYGLMRELDPWHPVWVNHTSSQAFTAVEKYISVADITGSDPYPIPRIEPGFVSLIGDKARRVSGDHRKAFWLILQAFRYAPSAAREAGRFPTFEEARCMTHLALNAGAGALFYFTYGMADWYVKSNPRFWAGLKAIVGEVRALEDDLLAEPAPQDFAVTPATAGLNCRLLRRGDILTLVAVNPRRKPAQCAFEIPALRAAAHVQVVSEKRRCGLDNGRWNDAFDPYAVHIYTTRMDLPPVAADFVVGKKHLELPETLWDPKNVASRRSGAKASASSERPYVSWGSAASTIDDNPLSFHMFKTDDEPNWIEVRFPKPAVLTKVDLVTRHVAFFDEFQALPVAHELQVWGDDGWRPVAKRDTIAAKVATSTLPGTRAQRIRFVFASKRPQVCEIKAYVGAP